MALKVITFTRILFPVDLSQQSQDAAPYVAAMARRFASELLILQVFEPQLSYYPIPAAATPAALKHEHEDRQSREAEFASFASDFFSDIPVRARCVEGDAALCIVSFAQENNVDLLMIPTHGCGRFRRLLLGSVTAKVLTK
jgi:nucleotide-binding universal stress UspA family protein